LPGVLGLDSGCTTQQVEEEPMIFVGDDWAEDHHDVHVMDQAGLRLASRRLPEGLSGIGQLHALIAEHAEEPDQVVVGIETDRGLWVSALVAAGYRVFAVNPLAVTAIATTSRGPSLMSGMPSCWPIWCAPIGTTIDQLLGIAQQPRRSRCWLVVIKR
jgi:Transposase